MNSTAFIYFSIWKHEQQSRSSPSLIVYPFARTHVPPLCRSAAWRRGAGLCCTPPRRRGVGLRCTLPRRGVGHCYCCVSQTTGSIAPFRIFLPLQKENVLECHKLARKALFFSSYSVNNFSELRKSKVEYLQHRNRKMSLERGPVLCKIRNFVPILTKIWKRALDSTGLKILPFLGTIRRNTDSSKRKFCE